MFVLHFYLSVLQNFLINDHHLFQTNGKSQTPNQSNLNINIVGINDLPDGPPQEFIDYVSRTYGAVSDIFILGHFVICRVNVYSETYPKIVSLCK